MLDHDGLARVVASPGKNLPPMSRSGSAGVPFSIGRFVRASVPTGPLDRRWPGRRSPERQPRAPKQSVRAARVLVPVAGGCKIAPDLVEKSTVRREVVLHVDDRQRAVTGIDLFGQRKQLIRNRRWTRPSPQRKATGANASRNHDHARHRLCFRRTDQLVKPFFSSTVAVF